MPIYLIARSNCAEKYSPLSLFLQVRLLRAIGADSVGMSLAPEVVASVHLGMLNMSITVISNVCFDDTKDADDFLDEEDVHQEV